MTPETDPQERIRELEALLLRSRAEFDNARRRTAQQRAEQAQTAAAGIVRDLLPVLDDFERAMEHEPDDINIEYAQGVHAVYARLLSILAAAGADPIYGSNVPFNPELHHAVVSEEQEECTEPVVIGTLQRGYKFHGKLLRPAMVKVAVPKVQQEVTSE